MVRAEHLPLHFALTVDELLQIARALEALGLDHGNAMLTWRDASPWIEVDVATGPTEAEPFPPADPDKYDLARLALWRRTLDVYRIGRDGAVEDDPFLRGLERG